MCCRTPTSDENVDNYDKKYWLYLIKSDLKDRLFCHFGCKPGFKYINYVNTASVFIYLCHFFYIFVN
jgi:hypothetical protein